MPIERWMPEQRMQRKQPIFQLAQRGSFFLQSTHTLLSGCLTSARRVLALASVCARDWVARDMMVVTEAMAAATVKRVFLKDVMVAVTDQADDSMR